MIITSTNLFQSREETQKKKRVGDRRKRSPQLLQWTIREKKAESLKSGKGNNKKKIWHFKETNTKNFLKNVAKDKNKTRKKKTLTSYNKYLNKKAEN